jgi:hypothetical protein
LVFVTLILQHSVPPSPSTPLCQVEEEVLRKYENDLLQKEHSGCAALLRDDKVRWLMLAPEACCWMLCGSEQSLHVVACAGRGASFGVALQSGRIVQSGRQVDVAL